MNESIPHKVLIVDDEPHLRAYLRLVVAELGATDIQEAGDCANALLMYNFQQPDLVLLDVNLPGEDGLAILAKLLDLNPDARVVMLTAVASREMVEKCSAAGALNYVRKDQPRGEMVKLMRETWLEACSEQSA
jgi:DNA-binding NarL/FixJ family response regulator